MGDFKRAKRQAKLPIALTQGEIELLQGGVGVRMVQSQLGHAHAKTREACAHVLKQGADGVKKPLSGIL